MKNTIKLIMGSDYSFMDTMVYATYTVELEIYTDNIEYALKENSIDGISFSFKAKKYACRNYQNVSIEDGDLIFFNCTKWGYRAPDFEFKAYYDCDNDNEIVDLDINGDDFIHLANFYQAIYKHIEDIVGIK